MDIITFGKKEEGKEYILRPAVYCLMFTNEKEKIAIIQTSDEKLFLPGGGIEKNETHVECAKRESLEEMGVNIEIGQFIGCARRYFHSSNDMKYYLNEGYFYLCKMGEKIRKPIEDHDLKWVKPSEAIRDLFHEHQSWAVNEALKNFRTTV